MCMRGKTIIRCSEEAPPSAARVTRRLRLAGHVQGVGFRPFVYRLAQELGLAGTVRNLHGEVEIVASGSHALLDRFARELIERAPPLARPRLIGAEPLASAPARGFAILESAAAGASRVFVPPDSFTCPDCLRELADPQNRRYRYPFINCTQCGPRYTLIEALPYDRANTTMSAFALCPDCAAEYGDVADRRFHAEPVACARCGPSVWLAGAAQGAEEPDSMFRPGRSRRAIGNDGVGAVRGDAALRRAVELLRAGAVLAVKGVGGYHLLCDAANDEAVERLRARKRRPGKPLAVMYPQTGEDGLALMRRDVELSAGEAQQLLTPARPIVLARRRTGAQLSRLIAPRLDEVGVFLPYSPLHHLLLGDAARPLVATSGNLSGEPVITEVAAADDRLRSVADVFVHHDRPITRPADDPVVRVVLGRPRTLRIGRGIGPLELPAPWRLEHPVLATGGQEKVTVALAWEDRVVVSPHIGELGSVRGAQVFAQVAEDLQRLYGVRAAEVLCDVHPDYASSRWALESGLPVARIAHHRAHASALAGEHCPAEPMLVFTWDGTGLGEDGTLWGGEAFLGTPGQWRRVGSLRPFRLPGAERAAREPWRCAAGVCWEIGRSPAGGPAQPLVRQAWRAGINSPRTSAAGRLFDAAAALLLDVRETSYEGEAPMRLEALARQCHEEAPGTLSGAVARIYEDDTAILRLDWQPLIERLLAPSAGLAQAAHAFHAGLAAGIVAIAQALRPRGFERVGLAGGVFQNALLAELAQRALEAEGLRVFLGEQIPCNDGGLSYGQIIEHAGRTRGVGRQC